MNSLKIKNLDNITLERLKHLDSNAVNDRLAVQAELYRKLRTCQADGCNTRVHREFRHCAIHEFEADEARKRRD